jgi:hypothetical protein
VINAIWSQALHSGTKGEVFKKHIIFVTNLKTSSITSNDASIFGKVGGGGRSGKFIVGKVGKSGNVGIIISGKTGNAGRETPSHGEFGKFNEGKFGNMKGLTEILNSGKLISKFALILCKSRIISGHFGNCITGVDGTTALISSQINVCKSFLSFLH